MCWGFLVATRKISNFRRRAAQRAATTILMIIHISPTLIEHVRQSEWGNVQGIKEASDPVEGRIALSSAAVCELKPFELFTYHRVVFSLPGSALIIEWWKSRGSVPRKLASWALSNDYEMGKTVQISYIETYRHNDDQSQKWLISFLWAYSNFEGLCLEYVCLWLYLISA